MWKEIKDTLHLGQSFLITTHVNPDGDGVGAAAALIELLLLLNKQVLFVTDSPLPEKLQFLDYRGLFRDYSQVAEFPFFDVLIVLDTQSLSRVGKVAELFHAEGSKSLCIDHHVIAHTPPFTPMAVIDTQACCVGAMIYTLYKESGFELNSYAAHGIYTSVISDTGRFSYASTSRKAHKIADECLKLGVDPSDMHARLYRQVPKMQIEIFRRALARMEMHFEGHLVLQQIRLSDYNEFFVSHDISHIQDFDMIHEFNKSIQGVQVAAILWELPDGCTRVSLRSNSGLDIVAPMKTIGGGGHPNAAGALLATSFDEAKNTVLNLLSLEFFL